MQAAPVVVHVLTILTMRSQHVGGQKHQMLMEIYKLFRKFVKVEINSGKSVKQHSQILNFHVGSF